MAQFCKLASAPHILVIDAGTAFESSAALVFYNNGYQVSWSNRIVDVVNLFSISEAATMPDVVLLDLDMPHLEGFCMLATLKELSVKVPILVLAESVQVIRFQHLKEMRFDGIHLKSLKQHVLVRKVKDLLCQNSEIAA